MNSKTICRCIAILIFGVSKLDAERKEDAVHYRFQVTDQPAMRRFVLRLESTDKRPICIYLYKWPDKLGELHFGSSWVTLTSSGGRLRASDANFGYCLGGESCYIRLLPGETLTGFVGYKQFGCPEKIAKLKNRELRFPVAPFVCQEWPPPIRDYRQK